MFKVPENLRVLATLSDGYKPSKKDGNNGAFRLVHQDKNNRKIKLNVIASDGMFWEHVSVTVPNKNRCPTWPELCYVKSMFWSPEDMVIQYHPPESEYVSYHDTCLHLWRPMNQTIPAPDHLMVAPKGVSPPKGFK